MNEREKKIAIFVGVAVGLYGIDQWLLEPYFDDLNKADDQIAHYQTALSDGNGVLQNRLKASKHWKEISTGFVQADASAAESSLLNRIHDCAQRANLFVSSYKTEKAEKEKGYDRISVKPTAVGTMQQISRFLYELRQSDIPVRVGELQITARKEGVDDLSLALTLTTIIQPPATPQQKVAMSSFGREALQ